MKKEYLNKEQSEEFEALESVYKEEEAEYEDDYCADYDDYDRDNEREANKALFLSWRSERLWGPGY